jgi:iron complex transport system substrate-binding protein
MVETNAHRPGRTVRFVIILLAILAVLVVAIEWSRRDRRADLPSPVSEYHQAQPFPRTLRDAAGETLTIADRPCRIVSQTLGTDEILLAICEPQRIVALSSLAEDDNYSNVAQQARQVAGRTTQGVEPILRLQPDLIFVASYSRAETVQLLQASHAPVFRFAHFDSFADIKSNIHTIGYAIGNDAEAEALVRQMERSLAAVRARVPEGKPPPRIMSFSPGGHTAGANTIFDDMVRAANAINVSAENGIKGFTKISSEKVAEWRPDFIVAGANHREMDNVRRYLLRDPVIATTRAGKAGRIIIIDNRRFLTVSHHVVGGVEDLADGLYGKRE